MAKVRVLGCAIAAALVAVVLAGCSDVSPPPGPTASQLPTLISKAEGYGPAGYERYDVTFVRFISLSEWPTVMTKCLESHGVTTVDFRLMQPGPYSYPVDPHGSGALARALGACSLQFPSQSLAPTLRTRAQWSYQWSYLTHEFSSCVRAAGELVSPFPTRSEYLSEALTSAIASPWSNVTLGSNGAPLAVVKSRCPETAPGL